MILTIGESHHWWSLNDRKATSFNINRKATSLLLLDFRERSRACSGLRGASPSEQIGRWWYWIEMLLYCWLGGDDIGLGCNFIVDWELPPPSSEQTGKKQDYIYASKCKCWYGPIFLWEAKQMFGRLPLVPCGIRRGEQVAASWSMLVCRQSQERKRMRVQGEVNKLRAEISRLKVRAYKGIPWRQTRALYYN